MTTADDSPPSAPVERPTSARRAALARWGVPALALVAGVALGAVGARVAMRRGHGASSAPSAPRNDPAAFVPFGVRGVLLADVAALRAAPALRPLFGAASPGEPCEAALLRRVGRIALAVPDDGLEHFAVAFTGDLPQGELLACARARRGRGAELQNDHYRGMDVLRVVARREVGLVPAESPAEIIYVTGGTVVAGAAPTARRMVDHALAGPGPAEGETAVADLRRRAGAGHAVTLAYYLGPGGVAALGVDDPALVHVVGVALGADLDAAGLRASVVLACDDFDSPRAVADALARARDAAAPRLRLPALVDALRAARVERGAAEVRVELALNGPELDALAAIASALLAPPPDDARQAPPPPGPPAAGADR